MARKSSKSNTLSLVAPKPVEPFTLGLAATKIHEGLQELYAASLGYRPQEKYEVANRIARLAVSLADSNLSAEKRKEIQIVFDEHVTLYSKKFGHTN